MKIFGQTKKTEVAETPPLVLTEVAIVASPKELRDIARFALTAASQMEKHGVDFGHNHLIDTSPKWKRGPDVVIVGERPKKRKITGRTKPSSVRR